MQIICKNCNSTFNIPDEKVPQNGAKTKCLNCKTQIIINPQKKSGENIKQQNEVHPDKFNELQHKKCPYCKEKILIDAKKCKWCQSNLHKDFENKAKENISKVNGKIIESKFYKNYWSEWNKGNKIICSSIIIAIISLFLSWADIGLMSQNGWQQHGYYLLICFVYPTYILFKKKEPNIFIGYLSSLLSTVLITWYIQTKTVDMHNSTVNISGIGSWVFFASTLLLGYGFYILGQGSKTNKRIGIIIRWIKLHKLIVLSIIILLIASPKIYNYVSVKFNKPYNSLINLSANSTADEIKEANQLITELQNVGLLSSASDHIEKIKKQIDDNEDDSQEWKDKHLAILGIGLQLSSQNLEISAPGMSYEELSKKYGSQKSSRPQISRSIRENCEEKWEDDYSMVKYCIEKQTNAKSNISSYSHDNIRTNCENKWGDDYSMVEYCIKKQTEAKRSIDR